MVVRVQAARVIVRILMMLGGRRMVVILRGRLRMTRTRAAPESERNANGKNDDSAALHGIRP